MRTPTRELLKGLLRNAERMLPKLSPRMQEAGWKELVLGEVDALRDLMGQDFGPEVAQEWEEARLLVLEWEDGPVEVASDLGSG